MSAAAIRQRREADIPTLAAVLVAVHERDGYPVEGVSDPVAWLSLTDLIGAWTATLDGQPVGHVALTRPGPGDRAPRLLQERDGTSTDAIAVLGRLFVSPEARRHALGRMLTKQAMRSAQAAHLRVVLDVMQKDQDAIALYESMGWQPIGTFEHVYGEARTQPATAFVGPSDQGQP